MQKRKFTLREELRHRPFSALPNISYLSILANDLEKFINEIYGGTVKITNELPKIDPFAINLCFDYLARLFEMLIRFVHGRCMIEAVIKKSHGYGVINMKLVGAQLTEEQVDALFDIAFASRVLFFYGEGEADIVIPMAKNVPIEVYARTNHRMLRSLIKVWEFRSICKDLGEDFYT